MKLRKIVEEYKIELIKGILDMDIIDIENDSRNIKRGSLFIAEKGFTVDGHNFIYEAIKKGAIAIVIEDDIDISGDITIIKVQNSTDALAKFASVFYGDSWNNLNMIGITGTNGKTSISYFIKSILEANNNKVGILGTMGSIVDGEKADLKNTTPNAIIIHRLLNRMVKSKVDSCIMEVSSHALELKRVEYTQFQIGIFTNLTKEHLDYHKTMEKYFQSKLNLFYKTDKYNIINIDDIYGQRIVKELKSDIPILTYGIKNKADIFATEIKYNLSKVSFILNTPYESIDITLNVPGEFSVYNGLAAAASGYANGINLETIKIGLEAVEGIKGRFEVVPTNTEYTVIIDFAHTADGLEKVLNVMDEFVEGRKIVVFGAGGNRDKTKRPEMGETVGKHADLSIVTSDNPRYEDPSAIIEDILVGMKRTNGEYIRIVDRIEAIKYALKNAEPKDIILLAGKGHETYTLINGKTEPCDEKQIVLDYLEEINN